MIIICITICVVVALICATVFFSYREFVYSKDDGTEHQLLHDIYICTKRAYDKYYNIFDVTPNEETKEINKYKELFRTLETINDMTDFYA